MSLRPARAARYRPPVTGERSGHAGTTNRFLARRTGRVAVGQLVAQVAPLRLKDAGAEVSPVCVAWKPRVAEAPGAREAL